MSPRPLVFVSGLTLGDYLLWNWSLNANHDVLALISGLTMPPLAVATLWLVALSLARLLARTARLPSLRSRRARRQSARAHAESARIAAAAAGEEAQSAAGGSPPSRKIAA